MDYEKEYKNLVAKIKIAHLNAQTDSTKNVLEDILPALRESEGDRIRKRIRLCLDECVHSDIIRDYERDECLAYLEKQEEQKPAWSEEDERIRQGLIEMYKNEHLVSVPIGVRPKDIISFLENLRPSWKPSEEQMRGLKFFLDFHRSQRNAGTTNWREYDAVESLYEQLLKKL